MHRKRGFMDYNPQFFNSALEAISKHDRETWRGARITYEEFNNVISLLKKTFEPEVSRIMHLIKAYGHVLQNSPAELREDTEQEIRIALSDVFISDKKDNPEAYIQALKKVYLQIDAERKRRQSGMKHNMKYDMTEETSHYCSKGY